MRATKRLKHSATVALVRFLLTYFNLVPRRFALATGACLGLIAWRLLSKERYRVARLLEAVYGENLTGRQRELIARDFFVHSGKNIAELLRFKKNFKSEIDPLVEVAGLEHFDAAYKRGRGVFGVTGHIGNFELLAAKISSLGYRCAVIGREMYEKRLDELLVANREAMGLENFSTSDSPKRIFQWLKDGGAVGVLIDTDSWRVRSEMIPFFGRMSNTPIGQSLIALKTGAALVPMACVRTEHDKYKLIIAPEVQAPLSGDEKTDAIALTRKCNEALEEIIDRYPDQWIWIHNRWRTKVANIA